MPSTFIDLTNMLLRRLNEVEIEESDFNNTRGVQSLAKDAIQASISRINQMEREWPFNAKEHTMLLTKGVNEYRWPEEHKISDWESFQIVGDPALGVNHKGLKYGQRDVWFRYHRDKDNNAGVGGVGVPSMVFPSHGVGFGVTPAPDEEYTIRFHYFQNYKSLTRATDKPNIPASFDTTIVDGAIYYMYMFRDNIESAEGAKITFQKGIDVLRSIYINHYSHVEDRRINNGGRM